MTREVGGRECRGISAARRGERGVGNTDPKRPAVEHSMYLFSSGMSL